MQVVAIDLYHLGSNYIVQIQRRRLLYTRILGNTGKRLTSTVVRIPFYFFLFLFFRFFFLPCVRFSLAIVSTILEYLYVYLRTSIIGSVDTDIGKSIVDIGNSITNRARAITKGARRAKK